MKSYRALSRTTALVPTAMAIFATALGVACGGDKPADPKTPGNTTATTSTATTAPTLRPPTPENVPNTEKASGVRISEEIRKKCGITDEEAYFAFDSSSLRTDDKGPLDKVAVCFTTGPLAGRALRLVGHADPRGPKDYNMRLGHQRADAVKGYLDQKMAKEKVESSSRGDEDAEGKEEVGYAKDRRVDVMLGQ